MSLTASDVRADFPILTRTIHGRPLVYLDSAATSQKPSAVIEAEAEYYRSQNANVLRSVHTLAEEATAAFEGVRAHVARFIGARRAEEVIFTRGTTEGLNLVARGYGDLHVAPGDEIVLTPLEHHSNLVPWQELAKRRGARLRFIDLDPEGRVPIANVRAVIGPATKIVTVTAVSNVLGTIVPIAEIAAEAHRVGAVVVVDGAQWVPHRPTDVSGWGADFLAFSGHKMCAPTGIGVLWGRHELLEETEPTLFGGEMIALVERDHATWAEIPARFEGGTPHIGGVVGLGAAMTYLEGVGMAHIAAHCDGLAIEAFDRLQAEPGVTVYGPRTPRGAVVSFNVDGVHPHDVAQVFDAEGVAIRAGHHCAQPLMRWLGVAATARASFYLYNRPEDIDALITAVRATRRYFRR